MPNNPPACLVCQRSDDRVPLIQITYRGGNHWVCPQHLPILIHKPEQLAGQLPGIEIIPGEAHHHD